MTRKNNDYGKIAKQWNESWKDGSDTLDFMADSLLSFCGFIDTLDWCTIGIEARIIWSEITGSDIHEDSEMAEFFSAISEAAYIACERFVCNFLNIDISLYEECTQFISSLKTDKLDFNSDEIKMALSNFINKEMERIGSDIK
jgi:hypothetical protein